ncbi:MAG TPA: hypothetical protein VJ301_12055 [Propionibacteriaceae bacterium]|nr:hypothetical protein [Propionibacteriaceae bacterium]
MEPIPNAAAADAWGGWLGEGLGPLKSLYMSTGNRPAGGSNPSKIWRLDEGSEEWVDDETPEHAEVINKIRNSATTTYAFFESPGEGQTWIISKSLEHSGSGGWDFESVHTVPTPVGGRGLAINGPEGELLFAGCSQNWAEAQTAEVYQKSGGGWEKTREIEHSLLWELEFDDEDNLWEFFSAFAEGQESALFVGGEQKETPPGGNISHATWFKGHMYVIGNLSKEDSNKIYRSADGGEWEHVHTLSEATIGDHVQMVPRGEEGELWYTGHNPFEAGYSLDGTEWVREESVPSFATGEDTNHLTAVAYYGPDVDDEKERGVYLFARDSDADTTRIFRDRGAGSLMIEVI